jgi:ribonuclease R
MSENIESKILSHLQSGQYRPQKPRNLARELSLAGGDQYPSFRDALRDLVHAGRVILGAKGAVVLPGSKVGQDEFLGSYRHNRRGFGFVVPSDPAAHEDLFIPPGDNGGAMTGDVVRARITSRGERDGRTIYSGNIVQIIERANKRFVGSLVKDGGKWVVLPDGNMLTEPISVPDAGSRSVRPGTKVVVELTSFPSEDKQAVGVITEVLGQAGEKDVDLRSIIVQYNLPEKFPGPELAETRQIIDAFDPQRERAGRVDLSDMVICTIDPDDAKDYDDAISLQDLGNGQTELGVHIADVSHFVKPASELDQEAARRGNSTYFPGFVIPMLPEVLSNGICSLQEGVPRLCKSAFITYDADARPLRTRFANTVITSANRLRYTEAQDLIDGNQEIRHPEGKRRPSDYKPKVIALLREMDKLARRLQKRRLAAGQLVLDLPQAELVLDLDGRVTGTRAEDDSFTHTLIEMFMVEANEAVARLLDSVNVPYLRRIHPEPELRDAERLRHFVGASGYKLPKTLDRMGLQALLAKIKGRPEAFAINLAVLKSLTRAEYSPKSEGHFALASEQYCHFTSPIRRYADLTVHRLLEAYIHAAGSRDGKADMPRGGRKRVRLEDVPDTNDLIELGRHLSFTERHSEDAERELRQVKILHLLSERIGEVFECVVTGITNFGLFVQLGAYHTDGLVRYEELLDDWWDVDERSGVVRGQRTGLRIRIGDVVQAMIVKVDVARRDLQLAVRKNPPAKQDGRVGEGKRGGGGGGGGGGGAGGGAGRRPQARSGGGLPVGKEKKKHRKGRNRHYR